MIDKNHLINACENLYKSALGVSINARIMDTIERFSMLEIIKKGAIIGLSGGADSVLLLIFMRKLSLDLNFSLKAIHVNHMIRGDEADEDEKFSSELCKTLHVDFESFKVNIPLVAKEDKIGLEEAARIARYRIFESESNNGELAVITAHNSTDNFETVIFNLVRGSGTLGLCGIAPVRENIVRPLIGVTKKEILEALDENKIPYVTDSTNFSTEYSRNYIRHEIIPKLTLLRESCEDVVLRATQNLRIDSDYLEAQAISYYNEAVQNGKIALDFLQKLHPAILTRVIKIMISKESSACPERVHFEAIIRNLNKNKRFEIHLPKDFIFKSDGNICSVEKKQISKIIEFEETNLSFGFTDIPELGIAIAISRQENQDFSSNVYNFSIQAKIDCAIINGVLKVRTKKDGDAYRYGGITRKLKKLFNDKKIPEDDRRIYPVICDDSGILWVPGFGIREEKKKSASEFLYISVYKKVE